MVTGGARDRMDGEPPTFLCSFTERGTPLDISPVCSLPQVAVAVIPTSHKRAVKLREAIVTQPETNGRVTGIQGCPWSWEGGAESVFYPFFASTAGEESSDSAKPLVHVYNMLITA